MVPVNLLESTLLDCIIKLKQNTAYKVVREERVPKKSPGIVPVSLLALRLLGFVRN